MSRTDFGSKIKKAGGERLTSIEESVARALHELASNSKDHLGPELKDLYISCVKEIDISSTNKKAAIVFVPFPLHKRFQKIQSRLIRELEKKLSGTHVCFIAQRTILSKQYKRKAHGQIRPRSRTLTAVHESILNDIVHPTQIVGKRTRCKLDGSKLLKVHLDPKDVKEVDYKLKTFAAVYKKLTNKAVEFMFPEVEE
jgi:small subunit ribosomal protein S7e